MEYKDLDDLISGLSLIGITKFQIGDNRDLWKEFWEKCDEIGKGFKGVRYPSKQDREKAWKEFCYIRKEAVEYRNNEFNNRKFKSKSHRDYILREISLCQPRDLFGLDPVDIDDMKSLGKSLKEAVNYFSENKTEMLGGHKKECYEAILEMRRVHDAWWEHLKKIRNEIYEGKQREWERKQEKFRERVQRNLEINYERLSSANASLQRLQDHADELRSNISSAWNDDYADRASGWLSETENQIYEKEQYIRRIEEWIREDEDKLK